jgi:hypothetical protein
MLAILFVPVKRKVTVTVDFSTVPFYLKTTNFLLALSYTKKKIQTTINMKELLQCRRQNNVQGGSLNSKR